MSSDEQDAWGDDWPDDDDDYNDGDDDGIGGPKLERMNSVKVKSKVHLLPQFTILSVQQVESRMNEAIADLASYFHIPEPDALLILRYFRWQREKAIEKYYESLDKINLEAGICTNPAASEQKSGEIECPLCYDDVDISETFCLPCGHRQCKDCWKGYISDSLKDGKAVVNLRCPSDCKVAVPRTAFEEFLTPKELEKYDRFCCDLYIEQNKWLSFCSAPNCRYLVECDPGLRVECTCDCGHTFCWICKSNTHRPATCEISERWIEKNTSESENIQWLMAKTKKCPKCRIPIEKNQGCNHMTCRSCSHEFCWLCKGDWSEHGSATGGFYKCNIYEQQRSEGKVDDEEKQQEEALRELERYTFYFSRFINHINSGNLAEQKLAEHKSAAEAMLERGAAKPSDVEFIMDGVNTVIECRSLLAWTYPIGYYLGKDIEDGKLILFEDLQQQLEKYTEHLHELSERDLSAIIDGRARDEIINYTRVTSRFRDNMMLGIENDILGSLLL